ncbi:hypothetical protein A2W32_00495 [candidate division WWE3 bacterium RBG_16_37_10]|uniref:Uncharacterized protein n=1 Tax=candidate division WWE3 bacterium RBG_16_37_10 TaxID=1802610 RepID=A0A1F4V208_UNCKA|nr:MAG: hypothetical protein A2W32_00495 [candidate division WWE3 bacterium RBG_16_37_10]
MIIIFNNKTSNDQITEITKIYPGYTKVVVDIKRNVLAAGGEYHIDCEQVLLADGSVQSDLWGGGFRFESKEVDFMGLTNYKANINHFSYEITQSEIREQVEKIIRKVFGNE